MGKQWIVIDTEDIEYRINLTHIQDIKTGKNNKQMGSNLF